MAILEKKEQFPLLNKKRKLTKKTEIEKITLKMLSILNEKK